MYLLCLGFVLVCALIWRCLHWLVVRCCLILTCFVCVVGFCGSVCSYFALFALFELSGFAFSYLGSFALLEFVALYALVWRCALFGFCGFGMILFGVVCFAWI